jgi:hypothetical protein
VTGWKHISVGNEFVARRSSSLAALAVLLLVGCGEPELEPPGGTSMPKLVRLRQEQPGVVGVQATEWTIRDGVLRRRKLLNDRVVSDEEESLDSDALRRVEGALSENAYAELPASLGRGLAANTGKLVLETDATRCEMPYMAGDPPESDARSEKARLRAIAEVIRGLGEN